MRAQYVGPVFQIRDVPHSLASIPADVVDVAIAAAVTWYSLSTAASSHLTSASGPHPFDALAIGLTTAVGAALAVRRRFPLAVLAACTVLVAVFEVRG